MLAFSAPALNILSASVCAALLHRIAVERLDGLFRQAARSAATASHPSAFQRMETLPFRLQTGDGSLQKKPRPACKSSVALTRYGGHASDGRLPKEAPLFLKSGGEGPGEGAAATCRPEVIAALRCRALIEWRCVSGGWRHFHSACKRATADCPKKPRPACKSSVALTRYGGHTSDGRLPIMCRGTAICCRKEQVCGGTQRGCPLERGTP